MTAAMDNESVMVFRDVVKVYPLPAGDVLALDGVSFRVERGEFISVMGPSGSGKSTLLNLMGGLDVPTSGSLRVAGEDLATKGEEERSLFRRTHVSYVFQAYHLMPTLTAAQNVELPLHLAGRAAAEARERAAKALSEVGLGERTTHLPDELSGGERQRVAIARALLSRPSVLLADEPTGNLDARSGEAVIQLFSGMRQDGVTVLVVTHEERVSAAAGRVLHLEDGRLR